MRTGTNQRPLTPGQGQQSQQESLAAAAAANPALAYTGMPGWFSHTVCILSVYTGFVALFNTYVLPLKVIRCWLLLPIMTRLVLWLWVQVRERV